MKGLEEKRALYTQILEVIKENAKEMSVRSVCYVLREVEETLSTASGYITVENVFGIAQTIHKKQNKTQ